MTTKVGAGLLSSVRAAESTLKREEVRELVASLPEGHPLEDEVERVKAEVGGDLSELPDGHPLIQELKAAKERYEQSIADDTGKSQERAREVRQAKKLDRAESRRKEIIEDEERASELRLAATDVNKGIDSALISVRGLYETVARHQDVLGKHRMNAARTERLRRLLYAFERGVSESKMGRV